MKKLTAIILLVLTSIVPTSHAAAAEPTLFELSFAQLLLSNKSNATKLAAHTFYTESLYHPMLMALTAFKIDQALKGNIKLDNDTIAWLIKALGESRDGRYSTFLQSLHDSAPTSKVRKNIGYSIAALKAYPNTEKVVIDSNVVSQINRLIDKRQAQGQQKRRDGAFYHDKTGSTLKDVLVSMGMPNKNQIGNEKPYRIVLMVIDEMQLEATYNDFGTIGFAKTREGLWQRLFMVPALNNPAYALKNMRKVFEQTDPKMIRLSLEHIYKTKAVTTTTGFDMLVDAIWSQKDTQNKYVADGLAWIVKSIGESKQARYKPFLQMMIDRDFNSKVTRYAKKFVSKLPDLKEPGYQWKMISREN